MRLGNLLDDVMCAEDPEEPGSCRASSATFCCRSWTRWLQELGDVAVAEASHDELTPAYGSQERCILLAPRSQSANTLAVPMGVAANVLSERGDGSGVGGGREGVQVPLVGVVRQLCSALDVRYTLAQGLPSKLSTAFPFLRSIDFKILRTVESGLDPQDTTLLVVHLNRIPFDPMLDPNSFWTVLEVADDLTLEGVMDLLSQEAHHVRTRQVRDCVPGQSWINFNEVGRTLKHDVRSPLTLVQTPVVALTVSAEDLIVSRIKTSRNLVQ